MLIQQRKGGEERRERGSCYIKLKLWLEPSDLTGRKSLQCCNAPGLTHHRTLGKPPPGGPIGPEFADTPEIAAAIATAQMALTTNDRCILILKDIRSEFSSFLFLCHRRGKREPNQKKCIPATSHIYFIFLFLERVKGQPVCP